MALKRKTLNEAINTSATKQIIETLLSFNFPKNGTILDLSEAKTGIYHVHESAKDNPTRLYGSCIAFTNHFYTVQLCIAYDASSVYIRGNINGQWRKII